MDSGGGEDVFSKVVDSDVHQLGSVQGTASLMGGCCSMSTGALEVEVYLEIGQAAGSPDPVLGHGVPGNDGIDSVKDAGPGHEGLSGSAFFGRTAEEADGRLCFIPCQSFLDGHGGG
ncbi:hypothetical protein SDC9_202180 [bioreactor metagenome]|uniref:Uncharacterized protein n=1 Tax=bioreactor metagenome TaxID=1076179 RepID=A0A645IUE5_9ZZZZ